MNESRRVLTKARRAGAAAALLAILGSGAALAQGAPPGSPSWQAAASNQARGANVAAARGDRATVAGRNRPVPVANNTLGHARRS
jgi:hypothetical protein